MPIRTVRDLIEAAMRTCGALDPGEPADIQEANDAKDTLVDLLDAWRLESLMVPYTASAEYETVSGQDTYTIGPDGDWDGTRPVDIDIANLRYGGVDSPLTKLTHRQYADIPVKTTLSTHPRSFYYEAQFPLGRFVLFPVPSVAAVITVSHECNFGEADMTLDTDISILPPGYRRAIRFNLAKELAGEYGRKFSDENAEIARDSKARIKSKNSSSLEINFDDRMPGVNRGHFDYRTG